MTKLGEVGTNIRRYEIWEVSLNMDMDKEGSTFVHLVDKPWQKVLLADLL